MSDYKITLEKSAVKFIRKQNSDTQSRLLKAINKLPDSGDIKMLQGYENLYRLRVGSFRVLFSKDDVFRIIDIEDIDNRGQIYK